MPAASVVSYRNSTSNHNAIVVISTRRIVVSYRNSTSNHNYLYAGYFVSGLYLIEILHQTTTVKTVCVASVTLYLIEILHQTTTNFLIIRLFLCCILSKFYIKPQLARQWLMVPCVVSYRNSTSNHNGVNATMSGGSVVSYRNSTSNHNFDFCCIFAL